MIWKHYAWYSFFLHTQNVIKLLFSSLHFSTAVWYQCDFMLRPNIVCTVVSLGLKKCPCSVGYMLLLLGILTHALYFESRMQWHGLNSNVSSQYSVSPDSFGTWSFLLARQINSPCMNVCSCKDHPRDPVKLQGSRVVTGEIIFSLWFAWQYLFAFFFFFSLPSPPSLSLSQGSSLEF